MCHSQSAPASTSINLRGGARVRMYSQSMPDRYLKRDILVTRRARLAVDEAVAKRAQEVMDTNGASQIDDLSGIMDSFGGDKK